MIARVLHGLLVLVVLVTTRAPSAPEHVMTSPGAEVDATTGALQACKLVAAIDGSSRDGRRARSEDTVLALAPVWTWDVPARHAYAIAPVRMPSLHVTAAAQVLVARGPPAA